METFEKFENVWDAIESDPKEAAKMKILSDLMFQILGIVKENHWSLDEAAQRFHVAPKRMDDVLAGRIYLFQPGELFEMVAALGRRVHVEIEAA
jgi:predicted XRE-type DNA-binding protein